ncbi:MAG: tyrosine-type recombinase/integrase [Gammaproteobacteria bacterium]
MADSKPTIKLPHLRIRKDRQGQPRYYVWEAAECGPDGKRKTISLGPIEDPRSLARYHEIEAEHAAPQNRLSWLFLRFRSAFLGERPGNQGFRRVKTLSPKTRREYRRQLEVLEKAFGAMPIRSLDSAHVQTYLESHPAPVSANREIALLSRIYTWAFRLRLSDANPCSARITERNEELARDRYITDEEYLARKAVAPMWIALLMDLAYLTALRLGDLLAISLNPPVEIGERVCWLDAKALYVQPQKTKKTGRRNEYRLEGALLESIRALLDIRAERSVQGMYLIANRRGQPYTVDGFESFWQRLKKKDGNRSFQFRDIRAKSATDAAEEGLNAQLLLAHSSAKTTEIYLRSRRSQKVQGPHALPKAALLQRIENRKKDADVIRFPTPEDEK